MTVIPVFRDYGQAQPAFSAAFQDTLCETWINTIPPRARNRDLPRQRAARIAPPEKVSPQVRAYAKARAIHQHTRERQALAPEIIRLNSEGVTITRIRQMTGVSISRVRNILRENNVTPAWMKCTTISRQAEERRLAYRDETLRLHAQGHSYRQMSKLLGINREIIRDIINAEAAQ